MRADLAQRERNNDIIISRKMKPERDIVLTGIHIGEHSFVPEKVIDEIYERVIKP